MVLQLIRAPPSSPALGNLDTALDAMLVSLQRARQDEDRDAAAPSTIVDRTLTYMIKIHDRPTRILAVILTGTRNVCRHRQGHEWRHICEGCGTPPTVRHGHKRIHTDTSNELWTGTDYAPFRISGVLRFDDSFAKSNYNTISIRKSEPSIGPTHLLYSTRQANTGLVSVRCCLVPATRAGQQYKHKTSNIAPPINRSGYETASK